MKITITISCSLRRVAFSSWYSFEIYHPVAAARIAIKTICDIGSTDKVYDRRTDILVVPERLENKWLVAFMKLRAALCLTDIHANNYVFNPRRQISGVPHSANGWIHCWEPFRHLHAFSVAFPNDVVGQTARL